jgi:DNA repair photolyase
MKLLWVEKKSQVLTPSSLPCLAKIPTINISAGCSHNCVYCYSKGYSGYPGDNTMTVYSNLAEKLLTELARKRKPPYAVYFCPSCDPFQPIKEILDCSFALMELLLNKNVGVQFVTKGKIQERFLSLFSRHGNIVSGQIGITCTDDGIRKILEPGAASVADRIENVKALTGLNVDVAVRADPLIYGFTDSETQIEDLCGEIANAGVKRLAVSYLFLRPAIRKSLESNISDKRVLAKILDPYKTGNRIKIGICNSTGLALPCTLRSEGYAKVKNIAQRFGISVHICGCKNNDIVSESCHISKPQISVQAGLFEPNFQS